MTLTIRDYCQTWSHEYLYPAITHVIGLKLISNVSPDLETNLKSFDHE